MLNEVGHRRPLISSAGGVAILVALPPAERAKIVRQNLEELARMGTPKLERFNQMLERSLAADHAINLEDVATGINSFALSIPDAAGAPFAAISVAGAPELFPASRGQVFADLLRKEVANLARKAAEIFPDRGAAPQPAGAAAAPPAAEIISTQVRLS